MKKKKLLCVMQFIVFTSVLTSCVTPDAWRPEEHRKQMLMCKTACEETGMFKYQTFTADCICRKGRK